MSHSKLIYFYTIKYVYSSHRWEEVNVGAVYRLATLETYFYTIKYVYSSHIWEEGNVAAVYIFAVVHNVF